MDDQVAENLNENFICIKVDRGERPDVDAIYIEARQMMTGGGGWPLTIIVTHEKIPFFAATYLPKTSRRGRSGLMEILPEIIYIWKNERQKISATAEQIVQLFQNKSAALESELTQELLEQDLLDITLEKGDRQYGGLGVPKFPIFHLWRALLESDNNQVQDFIAFTLRQIRVGGIYDQLAGGLHRYATDRRWQIPHFEKMLYDQAEALITYAQAGIFFHEPFFTETALDIFYYLKNRLLSKNGAFYSAEDADVNEKEGASYLWDYQSFTESVPETEQMGLKKLFNLKPGGNYFDSVSGEGPGDNILYADLSQVTQLRQFSNSEIRQLLLEIRETRPQPRRDEKILTDWNGMIISALARSSQILQNDEMGQAAEIAYQFIKSKLSPASGKLFHRYYEGEAGIDGFLDDYAWMIRATLDLYNLTGQIPFLQDAFAFLKTSLERFEKNGLFTLSPAHANEHFSQGQRLYDGAYPSGNSIMLENLLRAYDYSGDASQQKQIDAFFEAALPLMHQQPDAYAATILTWQKHKSGGRLAVLATNQDNPQNDAAFQLIFQELPQSLSKLWLNEESSKIITELFPNKYDAYKAFNTLPTLYFCENQRCEPPVLGLDKIRAFLLHKHILIR